MNYTNRDTWKLAKALFTSWYCAHGISGWEEAWKNKDDWDRGYWYSVAEYVLENFKPNPGFF